MLQRTEVRYQKIDVILYEPVWKQILFISAFDTAALRKEYSV